MRRVAAAFNSAPRAAPTPSARRFGEFVEAPRQDMNQCRCKGPEPKHWNRLSRRQSLVHSVALDQLFRSCSEQFREAYTKLPRRASNLDRMRPGTVRRSAGLQLASSKREKKASLSTLLSASAAPTQYGDKPEGSKSSRPCRDLLEERSHGGNLQCPGCRAPVEQSRTSPRVRGPCRKKAVEQCLH